MNKEFYNRLEKYQDLLIMVSISRWVFLLLTFFSIFFGFSLTYPTATLIIFYIHHIFNIKQNIHRLGTILYRRVYVKELY
jgi:hypothetical protein